MPASSAEGHFELRKTRRISWTASFTAETQVTQVTGRRFYTMKAAEFKLLNSLTVTVSSYNKKTLAHFSSCIMWYNIDFVDNMMTVRLQNLQHVNGLNDSDII